MKYCKYGIKCITCFDNKTCYTYKRSMNIEFGGMVNMYKIAVDDGHGISTSGKQTPDHYKENEFNHYTKLLLKKELEDNGFSVIDCSPTRDDNTLQSRCNIANNAGADIFVSIHYNAMGSIWRKSGGGIETYYHDNSEKGIKLAGCIHDELVKNTKLENRGIKSDTTLYKNGLAVLRNTNMPSVLVECGFMDIKSEAELMKSDKYRLECAREICKGICKYFGLVYNDGMKNDALISGINILFTKKVISSKSYWLEKAGKDADVKQLIINANILA